MPGNSNATGAHWAIEHYVPHGPGGATWGDGPVFEYDPLRRLVHAWRSMYDPEMGAASVSGPGWMFVLSSLKTLLETGCPAPRERTAGRASA